MIYRPATCIAFLVAFGLTLGSPTAASGTEHAQAERLASWMEPFDTIPTGDPEQEDSGLHCTVDGQWCAQVVVDEQTQDWVLALREGPAAAELGRYPLAAQLGDAALTLWPHIVRMPAADGDHEQTALIGVVTSVTTLYSGGGAGAESLRLLRVGREYGVAALKEVLQVPLTGWSMIRACFSEEHMEQRAGACHDEYDFTAELTLHEAPAGMPQFDYVTTATSFPGPVSRRSDSLANPALTKDDLIHVINDECSYHRVARFNPATDRFEFDSPAPDCRDFTVP